MFLTSEPKKMKKLMSEQAFKHTTNFSSAYLSSFEEAKGAAPVSELRGAGMTSWTKTFLKIFGVKSAKSDVFGRRILCFDISMEDLSETVGKVFV